jgi:hypothetical protein
LKTGITTLMQTGSPVMAPRSGFGGFSR